MIQRAPFRKAGLFLSLSLLFISSHLAVAALAAAEPIHPVSDAALRLVRFCVDPEGGLDERDIATLVDYVLTPKKSREQILPESSKCPGAYQEFDTRSSFRRFMQYSYNAGMPSVVTRPSSLRFSFWRIPRGNALDLPASWEPVPAGKSVILHGLQHDSNTPDLTTGVYYEYDLKRTLIWTHYRGRQALISISKQTNTSSVGEKGLILGPDSDWNYFYSGEPGSAKAGLGWVKSYIYDYFSVNIYVETGTTPAAVRTGTFQWIRAGWSGINFVRPGHILDGMKRFARNKRMILESPRLPAPTQIMAAYQWLLNMPAEDLTKKYAVLQKARWSSALQTGKIGSGKTADSLSFSGAPREQMAEELMLEFLKAAFGKPTPLRAVFLERIASL